jgi:hypothetical protein
LTSYLDSASPGDRPPLQTDHPWPHVAQLLPAGPLLGIPGGIGFYDGPRNSAGPATIVPVHWLVLMMAGTLLDVTVLTAIPARRSVAEVLQAEVA